MSRDPYCRACAQLTAGACSEHINTGGWRDISFRDTWSDEIDRLRAELATAVALRNELIAERDEARAETDTVNESYELAIEQRNSALDSATNQGRELAATNRELYGATVEVQRLVDELDAERIECDRMTTERNAAMRLFGEEKHIYDLQLAELTEARRALAEHQTSPELAAVWAGHGRAAERADVVAWLRLMDGVTTPDMKPLTLCHAADAIERGEHPKEHK